jgi:predicted metalloprotease
MRLGGEPESSHFEDRTGQGGGLGFGGGGGSALGCLIPLVMSRFGLGGVLILIVGYFVLSSLGAFSGGGGGILPGSGTQRSAPGQSTLTPGIRQLLTVILRDTEDYWGEVFSKSGQKYVPTGLIAYSNYDQSGCGAAQAAMGPFYCPSDQKIYIDPAFFNELSQRFGAPGDFAMAYVIAHEVGHHIQDLEGTLARAQRAQASAGRTEGNAVQVQVELQADCYAGVWAANAKTREGLPLLEPGDFEEGLRAAEAIGDDTLQRQMQGSVIPDSFTHGTSAQRMAALKRGFEGRNPHVCSWSFSD